MYARGDPKALEFIYKNLWIYSYMFTLQSPSKYSPFDAIHLLRCFFHCLKQFLNLSILMPFSACHFFVSLLPHRQNFLFEDIFHGETKKSCLGQDQVNREVGHEAHAFSGPKLLNTQHSVGRCIRKSPIMKWANMLSLQKKFTEAKLSLSQQRQLVHWHRWVPRTLT